MTLSRFKYWSAEVHAVPSLLVIVALWLPFGFAMSGLIEEWDLLGLFVMHGTFLVTHMDGPLAANLPRPLMPFAFGFSHLVAPDSFLGFHWMTIGSLFVKGCAVSFMVSRATRSQICGIVAAALVLVYPADTMQMSLRAVHIHLACALALLGAALFIAALDLQRRAWRVGIVVLASLSFFAACAIYEAALALWLVPSALMYVAGGLGNALARLRRDWVLALLWTAAPLSYVGFGVWASKTVATYQGGLVGGQGLVATLGLTFPKLFSVGAMRAFVGGWVDAVRIFHAEYSSYAYLIFVAIVLALVVAVLVRRTTAAPPTVDSAWALPRRPLSGRLIVAGVILALAGYAPFLASSAHVAISQRTFIWASPGAVLAWTGFLALLATITWRGAALVALSLTTLALGAQLFQFHHYARLSEQQRFIARQVVEQWDGKADGKTLVVVDGTNSAGHTWMLIGDELFYLLSYVYGHRIGPIEICHKDSMEWQRPDSLGRKGTCILGENGWVFRSAPAVRGPGVSTPVPAAVADDVRLEKARTVTIEVAAVEGSVNTARLHELETGESTVARRYRGVLAPPAWPFAIRMFKDQFANDHFKWGFGEYWSLELPTPGSGWREAEWQVAPLNQNAVAWKTRESSQLFFDFAPADTTYEFYAKIRTISPTSELKQLRIELNGVSLQLQIHSNGNVAAEIAKDVLKNGANRLDVKLPVDEAHFGLSAQFDSFEIRRRR